MVAQKFPQGREVNRIQVYKSDWKMVIHPWRYYCRMCDQRGYFNDQPSAFSAAYDHIRIHPVRNW